MGVKALKNEYDQACAQYMEMLQDIKDIEVDVANNLAAPELLERLKLQIQPIKDRYEQWSYIMFLLNEPTRKEKRASYHKRNRIKLATLDKANSIEARKAAAETALTGLKEIKDGTTA